MTDDDSADAPKTPLETAVEHAIEAFVYAPIGLLFEGPELLPELIEKGRNQVTMARMVGKFALEQGREEAMKQAGKLGDQAAGLLDFLGTSLAGTLPGDNGDDAPEPTRVAPKPPKAPGAARAAARATAGGGDGEAPATPVAAPVAVAPAQVAGAAAATTAESLAIPDYDGLSASQVVNRLAGLSDSELEQVRTYEAAHRGRKTILSKVAQLQAS